MAGGLGTRFSASGPKQLVELGGRPILSHSFEVVASSDHIDEIIVVANPLWLDEIKYAVRGLAPSRKIVKFVPGGTSRNQSVFNGVAAIGETAPERRVLVHDSVRPLVSLELFSRVFAALEKADAVIPVIESADPLIRMDSDQVIAIESRKSVFRGQSPQGFRLKALTQIPELTTPEELSEASTLYELLIAKHITSQIMTVQGQFTNIKVTQPIDHAIALSLLQEIASV